MNIKENYHWKKLMDAIDFMEGMRGPDHGEYILIMGHFKEEIEKRIVTAEKLLNEETD